MKNPNYRAHAAHENEQGTPSAEDLLPGQLPSYLLDIESEEVRELLEDLDDAIFAAIAGCEEQLNKAQELWPRALSELNTELIEESREHYLEFALEVSRRLQHDEPWSLENTLTAIELIEFLRTH